MEGRRGVPIHLNVRYSSRRLRKLDDSDSDDKSKSLLSSSSSESSTDSDLSEPSKGSRRDPASKSAGSDDDEHPNASLMDRQQMDNSESDEDQLVPPSPFILGIKPKLFYRRNHPGIVGYIKPKSCVAAGKGQRCNHGVFKDAISKANENINSLLVVAETSNHDIRTHYDLTKEKVAQYEKHSKTQVKYIAKIEKQNKDLEDKLSKRERILKDQEDELKRVKGSVLGYGRELKQAQSDLEKSEKKSEKELKQAQSDLEKSEKKSEQKLKQAKSDLVKSEKKLELVTKKGKSDLEKSENKCHKAMKDNESLKLNLATAKPKYLSVEEQLYMKQKELDMRFQSKIKSDLHTQDMKGFLQ